MFTGWSSTVKGAVLADFAIVTDCSTRRGSLDDQRAHGAIT
jgi:hypothetical protein